MLESAIQKNILNYLATLPETWTVKTITCNKNGVPDILVCHKGRFIGLEVKTPKGRVSKLQEHQIEKIKAAGGRAYVVRSVDDVKNSIIGVDNGQ